MNFVKKIKNKIWPSPGALTSEEWREWDKIKKSNYPFLYFAFETFSDFISFYIKRPIKDAYWWIRHRTFDKYHVINTGLKPGYYDVDTLMFHSCFSLLVRYVEEEKGLEVINWSWDEVHKSVEKEILSLYCWYKNRETREERWNALNPRPITNGIFDFKDKEYSDWLSKYGEQDDIWEKEDTDNLIRLIKIKGFLWT